MADTSVGGRQFDLNPAIEICAAVKQQRMIAEVWQVKGQEPNLTFQLTNDNLGKNKVVIQTFYGGKDN